MISAIVLAAGSSRRMGARNKLLLPFGQKTVIETVVDELLAVPELELIVVLGHEADRVRDTLGDRPLQFVLNERHLSGMTSSIQSGVRLSAATTSGLMICLSDLPLLLSHDYINIKNAFATQHLQDPQCILLPRYQNQKGHPIIFSSHYRSAILKHTEPEGCKAIIQAHPAHHYFFESAHAHILQDLDTPEDYQRVRKNIS